MVHWRKRFGLRIGDWQFQTHIGWILVYLPWLCLLLALANWQWQRAVYKESLTSQWQRGSNGLEQTEFIRLAANLSAFEMSLVTLKGQFIDKPQFFLDNRTHAGAPGYWIYQLFEVEGLDNKLMLVNRGWIGLTKSRNTLPAVPVIEQDVIKGRLMPVPSSGIALGPQTVESFDKRRFRIQSIDLNRLESIVGKQLLPQVVNLLEADDSLIRDWKPVYKMTPAKHRGYAFQWFSLALALTVIFIVTQTRRYRIGS